MRFGSLFPKPKNVSTAAGNRQLTPNITSTENVKARSVQNTKFEIQCRGPGGDQIQRKWAHLQLLGGFLN